MNAVVLLAIASSVGLLGRAMSEQTGLVKIEIETPAPQRPNDKFSDLIPLVTSSGWTLTLKLDARQAIGIGQDLAFNPFPAGGKTAFIVLDDPDGCFSPSCELFGPIACGVDAGPVCPPADETMIEFTADADAPGVPDEPKAGNETVRQQQAGPRPFLNVFDGNIFEMGTNTRPIEIGPEIGQNDPFTLDGYGPGADDDLPGLVLLIDSGFGLEFDAEDLDQDGDRAEVRGVRNLAGYVNQVGYTLSSSRHGGVNLFAQMLVPNRLTRARLLLDESVGPDGCAAAELLIRVNGGPPIAGSFASIPTGLNVPFDPVITVRAFVVNGIAPSRLDDLDGNGVFDAADAALAGYQIVSDEAVVEIEQYYQTVEDFLSPQRFDIDGDGFAVCSTPVGPGGPGNITPTPR